MDDDAVGVAADRIRVPGYVIAERIGAGGFGEVYRARHDVIGRDVAIKVLHAKYSADPDAVVRFIAEARAVNQISHPNIVQISDFGTLANGRQYLVMELIRGKTLRDELRERGKLPLAEALPILRGIAAAVDAAHAAGIAHRDLKPDNVFLVDGGGVKLIDFGLAKLTREEAAPVTQTGSVFGTPLYMSPEQCRGRSVTLATDAYSFGVLAYHVLVGEPPFSGDALELALHHLNDEPVAPSKRSDGLDERVDRVLLALLAKDPGERPMPLVGAIDTIEGAASLRRLPRRRRRRWPFALAALAVAGVAMSLAIALRRPASGACDLADGRLAGIWDAQTRNAIEQRFGSVANVDVAATWRRLSSDLDGYVTEWRRQWDALCRSPERRAEPLLHAQRTACLENALLQVESVTTSLLSADVRQFSLGFSTDYLARTTATLDDCAQVSVLREQRPPPPPELHGQVSLLKRRFFAARIQVREAMSAGDQSRAAAALDEYGRVSDELEALGVSGARESAELAGEMAFLAVGDNRHVARVRPLLDEAVARAEASNDDSVRARVYWYQARWAFGLNADRAVVEDWLERGVTAHVRSGRPDDSFFDVRGMRAWLDLRDGALDRAVAEWRAIVTEQERTSGGAASPSRNMLVMAQLAAGDYPAAVREARGLVERERASLGAHMRLALAHDALSYALWRSGDVAGALREASEVLAVQAQIGDVPASALQNAELWRLELALVLRDQAVVDEVVPRIESRFPAGTSRAQAWFDVARNTMHEFQIVCCRRTTALPEFALARARERATDPDLRARIDDLRAYRAFAKGDWATMESTARAAAARLAPDPANWIVSPWLVAVADARAGRTAAAESRLRELARFREDASTSVVNRARLFEAWVLIALGKGRDARALLEAARATTAEVRRDRHHTELTAWLAVSRLEDGDAPGAIAAAFESLSHWVIIDYFTPMNHFTLARALVATGGDQARARRFAEMARDGFARLGPGREPDRALVVRWLDALPPAPRAGRVSSE